jgi:hypothetical protein
VALPLLEQSVEEPVLDQLPGQWERSLVAWLVWRCLVFIEFFDIRTMMSLQPRNSSAVHSWVPTATTVIAVTV